MGAMKFVNHFLLLLALASTLLPLQGALADVDSAAKMINRARERQLNEAMGKMSDLDRLKESLTYLNGLLAEEKGDADSNRIADIAIMIAAVTAGYKFVAGNYPIINGTGAILSLVAFGVAGKDIYVETVKKEDLDKLINIISETIEAQEADLKKVDLDNLKATLQTLETASQNSTTDSVRLTTAMVTSVLLAFQLKIAYRTGIWSTRGPLSMLGPTGLILFGTTALATLSAVLADDDTRSELRSEIELALSDIRDIRRTLRK